MNATKRAQVPFGLRKKLMAATSMLLVAAIMLVSTSYAWFTLSTAPEITGITTSVGANGNLEIALLDNKTSKEVHPDKADIFADMSKITSGSGDSMDVAGKNLTEANITWGNLINLSDASYGLTSLVMYPSALNIVGETLGAQPLATPTYGADGRVKQLDATTMTAVYDGSAFTDNGIIERGVRAVGTADNVSPRQLVFRTAKSTALSMMDGAAAPVRSAFVQNKGQFMTLALSMQDGASATYTYEQVVAMKAIAEGVVKSLKNVVNAYANAGLATAAADTNITDDAVALCNTQLAGATTATQLKDALNTAGVHNYDSELTTLATQQATAEEVVKAANALIALGSAKYEYDGTAFSYPTENPTYTGTQQGAVDELIVKPTLGGSSYVKAYETVAGDDPSTGDVTETSYEKELDLNSGTITNVDTMYLTGGSVGNLAVYSGTYTIDYLDVLDMAAFTLYGGAKGVPGNLATLKNTVSGLVEPGQTSAATTLTTTYGYIIDFAFRTNAATSNLLLQTEAVNRVYKDATAEDLATMGHGSTATFEYADGLNQNQGEKLLDAMRVVFFDPDTNTILKGGRFTNIAAGSTGVTGDLKLYAVNKTDVINYVLGQNAYDATAGAEEDVAVSYRVKDTYTAENSVDYKKLITDVKYETLPETTTGTGTADDKYVLGKNAYEVSETKKVEFYPIVGTTADGKTTITNGTDSIVVSADNCKNYATKISAADYAKLNAETTPVTKSTVTFTATDDKTIVALGQNEPKKVSVLVYMDGENIDNSAVANGLKSGTLNLNLQFASDAELNPMQNSVLKNQTAG